MSATLKLGGSLRNDDGRFGLKVTAPAAILLAVLLLVPTVLTILYSLHDVPAHGRSLGPFVGLENYTIVLGSSVFWRSAWVTFLFSVGFVVLSTLFGLAMEIGRASCRERVL